MAFTIAGRVCARPCEGLEVPIDDGRIRLFAGGAGDGDRRELDNTERDLRKDGSFELIELAEGQVEAGEPISVDVWLADPCTSEEADAEEVRVTITTFEFGDQGEEREFEWCLTPDQYCQVMQDLGCRYVCGQITDCETDNPIPGLEVEVFDADIIQPDALGSDVTAGNGWYLIHYSGSEFERTPAQFAPIELIGGPDLFFEIKYGSNTLLDEDQSDGRQSSREDAGYCEHIDLCVDFSTPSWVPAAWLRIGQYQIPDFFSLNEFDAAGYTDSKKYAFFDTLPLEGTIPLRNVPIVGAGSNPIRYRFKVGQSQLQNGAQGTASSFNKIVDDANNLFVGIHAGTLVYQTQSRSDPIQVHIEPSDLTSGGWVRIDDAIRNAYQAAQNNPNTQSPVASLGSYKWAPTNKLAKLNTEQLTSESMPPEGNTAAGNPVPGSPPVNDEFFAIRFEAQERIGGTWYNLPAHGKTLNRIAVNNNAEFRKLNVVQLQSNACKPITLNDVDLAYTLYHPHLEGAELEIRRNDQNIWTTLNDSSTELSFFNVSSTASRYDHNYNDQFDISGHVDKECAYLVRLRSRRRLTTGRRSDSWSDELLAFCAEEA